MWSYLVLCGPTWSYVVLLGPIRWSYLVLLGPTWSYVVLCGPTWSHLVLCLQVIQFEFSDEICVESPLFIFLYLDSLSAFSSSIFLFDEVIVNILTKVTFFPLKKLEERDK